MYTTNWLIQPDKTNLISDTAIENKTKNLGATKTRLGRTDIVLRVLIGSLLKRLSLVDFIGWKKNADVKQLVVKLDETTMS